MRKLKKFKHRKIALIAFLFVLVSVFAFGAETSEDKEMSAKIALYNEGTQMLDEGDLEGAANAFQGTLAKEPTGTSIDTKAKYNLAYVAVLASGGEDPNLLAYARELLIEALRENPDDIDTRKQIEILTQSLQEALEEEGMSEEEIEEFMDPSDMGQLPSEGDEDQGEPIREEDF